MLEIPVSFLVDEFDLERSTATRGYSRWSHSPAA